ncbi:MAG: InlB B-repeat-containing protein, partial [Oscillospiraceae bacterium]|nr:InlB B-repeat-containing protein [Oscillospiraceae bacterium]
MKYFKNFQSKQVDRAVRIRPQYVVMFLVGLFLMATAMILAITGTYASEDETVIHITVDGYGNVTVDGPGLSYDLAWGGDVIEIKLPAGTDREDINVALSGGWFYVIEEITACENEAEDGYYEDEYCEDGYYEDEYCEDGYYEDEYCEDGYCEAVPCKAASRVGYTIVRIMRAAVCIEIDNEGNINIYPHIENYGVVLSDRGYIYIRLPMELDEGDIRLTMPHGWTHEISHEAEEIEADTECSEAAEEWSQTIYTVVSLAHTWHSAVEARAFVGIAPMIIGNPYPIHTVAGGASPTLSQWDAAIGTAAAGGNRVIQIEQDLFPTTNYTVSISGNRHIIIASYGTDLTNHTRDATIYGAPFRITRQGGTGRHFTVAGAASGASVTRLTLSHIVIDGVNQTAGRGGIAVTGQGHLVMEMGSTIQNNNATAGGGIHLAGASSATIRDGATIRGNIATGTDGGGGIFAAAGAGWLRIYGGTIGGIPECVRQSFPGENLWTTANPYANRATNNRSVGGGVRVGGRNFLMYGGSIIGNRVEGTGTAGTGIRGGGGLAITGSGSGVLREMRGGTIAYNQTHVPTGTGLTGYGGGGVYVVPGAAFTMTAGTIRNNFANSTGGGVLVGGAGVDGNSSFTMTGTARVEHNFSRSVGAGVQVNTNGTVTMRGNAEISNNATIAPNGGAGVRLYGVGTLAMYDNATISYNRATAGNGGGVSINTGAGNLRMNNNSSIHGNTARDNGGGIFVNANLNADDRIVIGGTSSVTNNIAANGGGMWVNMATTTATGNLPTASQSNRINITQGVTFSGNLARTGMRVDENLEWRNRSRIHPGNLAGANDLQNASLEWIGVNPGVAAPPAASSPIVALRSHVFNNYDINVRDWNYLREVTYGVIGSAELSSGIQATLTQLTRPRGVIGSGAFTAIPSELAPIDSGTLVLVGHGAAGGASVTEVRYDVTSRPPSPPSPPGPPNSNVVNWYINTPPTFSTIPMSPVRTAEYLGPRVIANPAPPITANNYVPIPDIVKVRIEYYHRVNFIINEGGVAHAASPTHVYVREGSTIPAASIPSTTAADGWAFTGWESSLPAIKPPPPTNATVINEPVTFTATFARLTQVLTFNPNDGTWPAPAGPGYTGNLTRTINRGGGALYSQAFHSDNNLVNPTPGGQLHPVRLGYRFEGWFTASTGGTLVQYSYLVTAADDQTLYAQWTRTTQVLTFNPTDGTWPAPAGPGYAGNLTRTINRGAVDSLGVPTDLYDQAFNDSDNLVGGSQDRPVRDGWHFLGWFTDPDPAVGARVLSTHVVSAYSARTLYAHWTQSLLAA